MMRYNVGDKVVFSYSSDGRHCTTNGTVVREYGDADGERRYGVETLDGERVYNVCESMMSPICDGFDAVLEMMAELHKKKDKDYGSSFTELCKRCGWAYAYGHLYEKLSRVENLFRNGGSEVGESIDDSLIDLASYAVMALVERRKGNL